MELQNVEEAVMQRIAEVMEREPTELEVELRRRGSELPVDSLDAVEALVTLEDDFAVELPTDERTAAALRSVHELSKLILEQVQQADEAGRAA